MTQRSGAQDVIRCGLCRTSMAQMQCDTCYVNLCKACVGDHMLSEDSMDHRVVRLKIRKSSPVYPCCKPHTNKTCEMYCQACDLPICTECVASGVHKDHRISQIIKILECCKQYIQEDNLELQTQITPLYQKMLKRMLQRMKEIEENCEEADKAINKHGEYWHEEVDKIVSRLKTELQRSKEGKLNNLKDQVSDIKHTIFKISSTVGFNNDILKSNNFERAIGYTAQNDEFRKGPVCNDVLVPTFKAKKYQQEKFAELFGSLSTVESEVLRIPSPVLSHEVEQALMNKVQIITMIPTGIPFLQDIALQGTEKIWAHGKKDTVVKLFNIHESKKIKSFKVLSMISFYGYHSNGISVTKGGDLIYCCSLYNTVNTVVAERTNILISLQDWSPRGVCITSEGDMLISMTHKENPPKVVRYSGIVDKQTIQYDAEGKPQFLIDDCLYLAENKNKDICVSGKGKVVVVRDMGTVRFIYGGFYSSEDRNQPLSPLSRRRRWRFVHAGHYRSQAFNPKGVATDSHCHILIADSNNKCVHIIDQDGYFLRHIDCGMKEPWGLCIDSDDFLFVADSRQNSGEIEKIKYLK